MSGNIQDFLDDVPTKLDDISAELMYQNNTITGGAIANSLVNVKDRLYDAVGAKSAATLLAEISVNTAGAAGGDATEAQQILQTALLTTIDADTGSSNTLLGTIDTSLNAIELDMAALETLQTTTNAELGYLNNHSVANCASHSLVNILSAVNSILATMGAATSNNVEFDFKTEYINSDTGTIVLENDKTGAYHIVADDCSIRQFKAIQMGENGQADYTIYIKVYSVGGGGVLTLLSTRTEAISVPAIVGMNSVYYLTNEPTKTDLVWHFPFDYSRDDVMNSGVTIHGGELVKDPKIGFRSFNVSSRFGAYTSNFDLSSYGTAWTFAFWYKVVNQDPINTYLRIFSCYDMMNDTSTEKARDGFVINLNNKTSYNTKPYVDYRINCYDNTGTAITMTAPQASFGSGTTNIYFDDAAGQYMDTWTHFAFSRDGNDLYRMYQNGLEIATITTASTITFPDNSGVKIGGASYLMNCVPGIEVDDFRFYEDTIDITEIAKMANTSLSVAAGGILLTDLDPVISVSKNQLLSVEVAETTAVDSGTEELLVTLVGLR